MGAVKTMRGLHLVLCAGFLNFASGLNVRTSDCTPSESIYGSVAFSIDNTGSVSSSSVGVMSLTNGIIDKLLMDNFTIPRWVLTTFSDGQPYHVDHEENTNLRIVTNNVHSFSSSLNTISFSGGGDGPERATQGILLTLQNLPMYGVAMVVTDHQTKDLDLLEDIIALKNAKKQKVFLVLAPRYAGTVDDESWKAYKAISDGHMYNMADFNKASFISEVVVQIGQNCEDNNCCKKQEHDGDVYTLVETSFLGDPY